MASLVLGVVGGAVGYMVGGPAGAQVGFALGSAAGGLLFPPKGPDGPRLGDLNIQGSAYGQPIPIPYGTDRVAGNVIWADKIQEHADEQGGKGGPTYTTYSYTCSLAVGIVEGPIAGILRIWADGLLIYDRRPTKVGAAVGFKAGSHKIYLGTEDQLPDPTIQAIQGDTPAYRGLAYIVFTDLQLGKFGNRIPSLTFEYVTNGSDFIPQASTFGEAYGIGGRSDLFTAAMDEASGHIWLTTMSGHAKYDPATGTYGIDASYGPVPQIQEYDPVTKEILHVIEPTPVIEAATPVYPMRGQSVVSGGWLFIGRGLPGVADGGGAYVHGLVVNTETRTVLYLTDECSHEQLQNAFYWATVPVPVIRANKVFMAAGNGSTTSLGIGFMPAAVSHGDGSVTYPVPDTSQGDAVWSFPAGARQARAEAPCPIDRRLEGVNLSLPDWAHKSTVIDHGNVVIVQGNAPASHGAGATYLTWVTNDAMATANALDLTAPQTFTTYIPSSSSSMPTIAWDETTATLWVFADNGTGAVNQLYAVKRQGGELTLTDAGFQIDNVSGLGTGDVSGVRNVLAMSVDQDTGYLRAVVNSLANGIELVQIDPVAKSVVDVIPTSARGGVLNSQVWDYPELGKVITADGFYLRDIPYGSPLNANPANLGAIVANISERAGLTLNDIDVTELTDMVDGYTITRQMAARSAIEPLMQAYAFDPVESDYLVKFRKRGRPSVVTIPDDDLAAHSAGADVPDLVQVKRKNELDLPRTVWVKYKDVGADYQTGTQYDRNMATRSDSDVTVDIPIAMTADKAKQIAVTANYSAHAERTGLSFATSLKYAALEPTDYAVVHNRRVRIVHRKRNGGILEWEAYADGNTIYPSDTTTQSGVSAPSGSVGQVITTTPATQLVAIDAPIAQPGTTGPVLSFAVQGQAAGFNGAQIWKSVDGGVSYQPIASAPNASLIGTAQNALGAYAGGDTFDELNTVRVKLLPSSSGATLASATELQVLNGANAALLGDEVLQYKRAVLNNDGTYTLSGLLRYRQGTDYAVHTAGETFVPLTNNLVQIPVSTSEIGIARQYKAVSNGGTLAEAQAVTMTYTGADLKPYSPVQIGGWRDAGGNLTLTWVRRTRIGGEWRDGVDVPLGEASEAYDVAILNGSGAVVRTFSGVTSPTLTYTAAQQVADFGSQQPSITARIYQLSSIVGRGFPGTGSV